MRVIHVQDVTLSQNIRLVDATAFDHVCAGVCTILFQNRKPDFITLRPVAASIGAFAGKS